MSFSKSSRFPSFSRKSRRPPPSQDHPSDPPEIQPTEKKSWSFLRPTKASQSRSQGKSESRPSSFKRLISRPNRPRLSDSTFQDPNKKTVEVPTLARLSDSTYLPPVDKTLDVSTPASFSKTIRRPKRGDKITLPDFTAEAEDVRNIPAGSVLEGNEAPVKSNSAGNDSLSNASLAHTHELEPTEGSFLVDVGPLPRRSEAIEEPEDGVIGPLESYSSFDHHAQEPTEEVSVTITPSQHEQEIDRRTQDSLRKVEQIKKSLAGVSQTYYSLGNMMRQQSVTQGEHIMNMHSIHNLVESGTSPKLTLEGTDVSDPELEAHSAEVLRVSNSPNIVHERADIDISSLEVADPSADSLEGENNLEESPDLEMEEQEQLSTRTALSLETLPHTTESNPEIFHAFRSPLTSNVHHNSSEQIFVKQFDIAELDWTDDDTLTDSIPELDAIATADTNADAIEEVDVIDTETRNPNPTTTTADKPGAPEPEYDHDGVLVPTESPYSCDPRFSKNIDDILPVPDRHWIREMFHKDYAQESIDENCQSCAIYDMTIDLFMDDCVPVEGVQQMECDDRMRIVQGEEYEWYASYETKEENNAVDSGVMETIQEGDKEDENDEDAEERGRRRKRSRRRERRGEKGR